MAAGGTARCASLSILTCPTPLHQTRWTKRDSCPGCSSSRVYGMDFLSSGSGGGGGGGGGASASATVCPQSPLRTLLLNDAGMADK